MVRGKAKGSRDHCDHEKHHATVLRILNHISRKVGKIMATQAQFKADLEDITKAVAKIGTETSATLQKVADLEAAIAAGGTTTPEVDAALAALKAQVKVVDDLVVNSAS